MRSNDASEGSRYLYSQLPLYMNAKAISTPDVIIFFFFSKAAFPSLIDYLTELPPQGFHFCPHEFSSLSRHSVPRNCFWHRRGPIFKSFRFIARRAMYGIVSKSWGYQQKYCYVVKSSQSASRLATCNFRGSRMFVLGWLGAYSIFTFRRFGRWFHAITIVALKFIQFETGDHRQRWPSL